MFKDIIKNKPEDKKAFLSLIRLLYEAGSYNEALELYNSEFKTTAAEQNISETASSDSIGSGETIFESSRMKKEESSLSIPDFMTEGALWEDRNLPVFLSGNSENYLRMEGYSTGSNDASEQDLKTSAEKNISQKNSYGFFNTDYLPPEIRNDINAENLFFHSPCI